MPYSEKQVDIFCISRASPAKKSGCAGATTLIFINKLIYIFIYIDVYIYIYIYIYNLYCNCKLNNFK